jgi:hypothetical protein
MPRRHRSSILPLRKFPSKASSSIRRVKFEGLEPRTMFTATGDFNGDGFDDAAVGMPEYNEGEGRVEVRYGSTNGPDANSEQVWTLDSLSVNGHAHAGDGFGTALAVGDFNADGYDDLAIGTPGKSVSGKAAAGTVTILYGSKSGLRAVRDELWSQDTVGIDGRARVGEHFGAALAAGDFDGDGDDDLAIGTPGERSGERHHKGVVNVLFGSRREGLRSIDDQTLRHLGPSDINNPIFMLAPSDSVQFGSVLAAGDFNGDGRDDLAVTIPQMSIAGTSITSAVDIFAGSDAGLNSLAVETIYYEPNENITTATSSLPDEFGAALAAGDFNGDGLDDLAISAPGEESVRQVFYTDIVNWPAPWLEGVDLNTVTVDPGIDVGRVHIHFGSENGLLTEAGQWLAPQQFGLPQETYADFGRSLAAGDFDGDGHDDLAIGVPQYAQNETTGAGLIAIAYSRTDLGLYPIHSQHEIVITGAATQPFSTTGFYRTPGRRETWRQGFDGLLDAAEVDDHFGALLAAGDFDGNGVADLAVGVPGEGSYGATAVLYGYPPAPGTPLAGLASHGNQLWLHGPKLIVPPIH